MKKLPLILSVISVLAVITLFVMEFTDKDEDGGNSTTLSSENVTAGDIAYVDVDTIIFNFEMYFDLRDDLMAKQQSSEAELTSKGRQYEAGAKDYEDKVRKGLVTRATAAQMEQDLMQQQQDLINLRDQLQATLMEEEQVMNRRILEYIYKYLDEFTTGKDYKYILGKSFGGPVLYSNKGLDVTQDVLKGINVKYLSEKK